jgi:nucleoside phosphorylase
MRPRSRDDFAIAIICALPLEAEAVEALFNETYDRLGRHYGKQRGDPNAYINGRISKHDVVLCYMPGMGKGSAAGVASSLLVSYPGVKLALVVRIYGGAPSLPNHQEIFLGDVIISDLVIKYDFGRQYPGGFQRKTRVKDTLGRLG